MLLALRARVTDWWILAALGAGVACAAEVAFEIVEWAWLWEPLTFETGYLDLVAGLPRRSPAQSLGRPPGSWR